ncbi:MAG: hypothetical protein JXB50_14535 [Spirochaetes bacterium]|nr:hypothetical protein [Spirochaetota bacterium]
MNMPNMVTLISTLIISLIFFSGVFINMDVKRSKEELELIMGDIDKIKLEIKRQKIEIATLTSPHLVLEFIKRNNLTCVSKDNIEVIYIEND